MTPKELGFLKTMSQACVAWEATVDIPYKRLVSILAICQSCIEAEAKPPQLDGSGGWGSSELYLQANNPFGIKYHLGDNNFQEVMTWEVQNGQRVNQVAKFQKYPTLSAAVADHANVLLEYNCVRNSLGVGLEAAAEALGPKTSPTDPDHMTYSTSPAYPQTICTIAQECGFTDPSAVDRYAAS